VISVTLDDVDPAPRARIVVGFRWQVRHLWVRANWKGLVPA